MPPIPIFSTPHTNVYYLTDDMTTEMHDFIMRNKAYLAPFEPIRSADYYELESTKKRIHMAVHNQSEKTGVSLVFTMKDSQKIIGTINFSNFVFGVFQACHLGYSIDESYQSKGLMTEVLHLSLPYIHAKYGLRRFMANYMPDNYGSGRVLEKLGFDKEGYAKSYLKINGTWQDHVLTAFVFDDE